MDKQTLRQQLKARRDALAPEVRAAWSGLACGHVTRFAQARGLTRWGIFWPLGSEIDLRPLQDAHPQGAFYFPRVVGTRPPRLAWGKGPLEASRWGLQEPVHAGYALPPVELLLVPGLGFDLQGYRLGYGGGFYDALMASLDSDVLTLGIGYACQRVPELPLEPLDRPVQGFASEEGLVWFRG